MRAAKIPDKVCLSFSLLTQRLSNIGGKITYLERNLLSVNEKDFKLNLDEK